VEWKELIIVPIDKKDNKTGCSNYRVISFLPTTYKLLSNILVSRLIPYAEEIIGAIIVDFDTTGQLLIIYSAFVKYLRIIGNTTRQFIDSLYTARKLVIQLGGRSCIIFSLSLVLP